MTSATPPQIVEKYAGVTLFTVEKTCVEIGKNISKIYVINAEIIPTGDIVQFVRENIPEIDYENGGLSLCRDGFHLSEDYGRFLAGAVWFKKLTGKNLKEQPFQDVDFNIIKKLITVVNEKV